jgi:tight adherence protein C
VTFALVLVAGVLVAAGLVAVVAAVVPSAPSLEAALARAGDTGRPVDLGGEVGPVTRRSERLGVALYRRSPIPLSERQRQALRLQDKSIAEFYADKAVMALLGAALPAILGAAFTLVTGSAGPLPAVVAVLGAAVGFFVPDLLLHRASAVVRSGAVDALLLYIELVTLERLTNASAPQALQNAAGLSVVPLFVQIRSALLRARLEQQPPYPELRRLAAQLDLPELGDVADVMQLDETGAALSGALRARLKELRDGHLTQQQIKASAEAEGMTLYMTLPALVFGLIFLVAAMLKIFRG